MNGRRIDVSLNFLPAFFHKHIGLGYADAYYFDPLYRAEVECAEARYLYEILGRFGVGSPTPSPSPSLFIQPIDILKATQGAVVCCPVDATLETRGHVWSEYSVAEIEQLDPRDAANHPFINTLLAEYQVLQRLYGDKADLLGLKDGMINIHTPFTTAHQLCGDSLFYLMMDDPIGARVVFDKILALYQAVFGRLSAEIGAPPAARVNLGDCSAGMISAEQYRAVVLPVNQAIAATFSQANYHSCGASSHLLSAFTDIPGVLSAELGPGTDLAQAVRYLPGVAMRPLVDPLVMRNASPDAIDAMTRAMVTACASAPATTLCAWSFDPETPVANVAAMYSTVKTLRQPKGKS